jgi:hypothetical protein
MSTSILGAFIKASVSLFSLNSKVALSAVIFNFESALSPLTNLNKLARNVKSALEDPLVINVKSSTLIVLRSLISASSFSSIVFKDSEAVTIISSFLCAAIRLVVLNFKLPSCTANSIK